MSIPDYPAPLLFYKTMPDEAEIIGWLRRLRSHAYVPGSRYQVASIVMMRVDGGFYFAGGVNVECYEHRLNMHGEESAIAALTTAFGKNAVIDEVWLMAAPDYLSDYLADNISADPLSKAHGQCCGNCRQQISGLARTADIAIHSVAFNGVVMTTNLDVLLPHSFSFADFDPAIAASIESRFVKTGQEADIHHLLSRLIRRDEQDENSIFQWLSSLESIDYASGRGQAVVLVLDNGAYVAGVKFENAAYTGQGAMQSALGIAVTVFGEIGVVAAYAFSNEGVEESEREAFYLLPLSAFQSLSEFTAMPEMPVTLFNVIGDQRVELFRTHASFARPFLQGS